jgi:hypothetical protein
VIEALSGELGVERVATTGLGPAKAVELGRVYRELVFDKTVQPSHSDQSRVGAFPALARGLEPADQFRLFTSFFLFISYFPAKPFSPARR